MNLLREPLVHFVGAGAVLFAAYAWFSRDQVDTGGVEPVRVTDGDVRWLVETWSKQWLREPSPNELRGMIADLVNEELMAREALEMGLEKDDTIVRRRLAQKLKFLVEDTAHFDEPTEDELRSYYASHADRFKAPATVSFTQVFFNPAGRDDASAAAETSLVALQNGRNGGLAATIGDRFLLDGEFQDLDLSAVSGMFGPEFAAALFGLESGAWSGPIRSAYGLHLVFISKTSPAVPRPFEEVRGALLADWWREKEETASRVYMDRLRAKYGIELDAEVEVLLGDDAAPNAATTP
jgi:PPIC-type PPIASE domain